MNHILDYLNNLLDNKTDLIFPSFKNVQVQDPLSKLIKWLNTERGNGIKIKSEEDILIEDFIQIDNNKLIQLNLDTQNSNKIEGNFIFKGNRRNPNFPTEQQKAILKELKKVPVYTVVNGKNEIILASPRDNNKTSSLDWFYSQYYNWFIWKKDEGPITVGLFFSNKEDAESYLHEVCLKDPRGAENLGLNIKSTGLDTFYYLNRTSTPKVQLRIISNLHELDQLLKHYIKQGECFINPKQKYGSNWFKGTPIYIMRTQNLNADTQKESVKKKLIFFNKNDIEKVLAVYRNDEKKLKIKEPNIEIYNLENYILDLEKLPTEIIEKISFFPPYESYKTINESLKTTKTQNPKDKELKNFFIEKQKSVQRFCKGVIWLVTSDTLPSEENSW